MYILYLLLGLIGGLLGGTFGIGGGTLMVPALVYFFGLSQHQAQGTSLAIMLPPVGLLAVLRYYYSGNIKIDIAVLAAIGFLFGALIGANYVHGIAELPLKRAFGIFLILTGLRMALAR